MPAIQRSEFALALNQVSNERGLDPEVVMDTVRNAILAAYRKDHPDAVIEEYEALLDQNTGEAKILHGKEDVTPPGFGRIAAQTAKQVILQKIREKEKEAVISDFRLKIGTIINGMVLRFAGPNVIVDIGKAEAIMPPEEQIQNEKYHLNQRLAFYVAEIKEGPRGEEVVVSRASTGLLEGLFKREVPEVAQGAVLIKQIVREAGNRSKVAVASNQSGIDPVGSCVGQKGVRVQAIIQEFSGIEKIDIIQWQENIKSYIAQALSPAKELSVEINEKEKLAKVSVAPEELSLAIGKDGQNVRLASKLTGFRIEIEGDESLAKIPAEGDKKVEARTESKAKAKEEVKTEKAEEEVKEEVEEEKKPSSARSASEGQGEAMTAATLRDMVAQDEKIENQDKNKDQQVAKEEAVIEQAIEAVGEEISAKKNSEEDSKEKASDQS
jgi:transcription termination/antitermination protein NusA